MKSTTIRPNVARLLMPDLANFFPQGLPSLTPSQVREIRARGNPESVKIKDKRSALPPVIVTRMAKGGVGKTTVIGNIASAMAFMGYKILLIDGDPQGSLTGLMGIDWTKEGLIHVGELMRKMHQRKPINLEKAVEPIYAEGHLDLIPADITLAETDAWMIGVMNREQLFENLLFDNIKFFSRYDCIMVDTAPSTSLLTNALMLATREILAVTRPDLMSVMAMEVLAANIAEFNAAFRDLGMDMLIVVNGWHGSYKDTCTKAMQSYTRSYPGKVCGTILPHSVSFTRATKDGSEIADGFPALGTALETDPLSESAAAIAELARFLIVRHGISLGQQGRAAE